MFEFIAPISGRRCGLRSTRGMGDVRLLEKALRGLAVQAPMEPWASASFSSLSAPYKPVSAETSCVIATNGSMPTHGRLF